MSMCATRLCLPALFAVMAVPLSAIASTSGAPEGYTGGPANSSRDCTWCHGDFSLNSGPGSVSILDLPTLYVPDTTYTLRVRVADSAMVGAGFQMSVEDPTGVFIGQLIVSDAVNTENAGNGALNYITQSSLGVDTSINDWGALGNAAEYTFQWQAPSLDAGAINFHAAGAAINDGSGNGGDFVYTTAVNRSSAGIGDFNGDGVVDTADLGILLGAFGTSNPVSDVNNDGVVDTADLGILLGVFGT